MITKSTGAANFDLSDDGTLVYIQGSSLSTNQSTPVYVDHSGREEVLSLGARDYRWGRVSPDGLRVAFEIFEGGNTDIWVSDLSQGTLSRVTTDQAVDRTPLWTPDGERIVFSSDRNGQEGIFWRAADGSGDIENLATVEEMSNVRLFGWSPDGSMLLFGYVAPETNADIGVFMMGERSWWPLLVTGGIQGSPMVSPDGNCLAYNSNETGQHEVYVERFPDGGSRRRISTDSGVSAVWLSDGGTLFYRDWVDGAMMRVDIETQPTLVPQQPELPFETAYLQPAGGRDWDLTPDGERFLLFKPGTTGDASLPPQIVLVQNWFEDLARLVPVD